MCALVYFRNRSIRIYFKFKAMKNKYFTTILVLGLSINSFAQTTVSLGVASGSGSTNVLLSTSTTINRFSRTMSVYTATEIVAAGGIAGAISSLAWDKSGPGEYTTNDAYIKIFLKHATNNDWPTAPVPTWDAEVIGATEVFTSSTYSIPTGIGWKAVPFTTPFLWNGVDNIVVMVEWDRSSAPTGAINWGRSTNANANATRVGSASLAALVMIINSNRPLVQLVFNATSSPITSVAVTTQGGVPATIATNAGTLQMEAAVLPVSANQAVTWSLTNGTGAASISATGLVTAQADGTVWAKAVSVGDSTIMDSLQIALSNQLVPVTGVVVTVLMGAPTIPTQRGTLQMAAVVLPANANQDVTWSIVPGTGTATITTSGLIAALTDGTVWAKAVSVTDLTKIDSLEITITNQTIGLHDHRVNPLLLYPNPVDNGVFTLSVPQELATKTAEVSIFSTNGKRMLATHLIGTSQRFDVQNWPAGTYVLRYEAGSTLFNQTFIVK